jgi:hypothetical protein
LRRVKISSHRQVTRKIKKIYAVSWVHISRIRGSALRVHFNSSTQELRTSNFCLATIFNQYVSRVGLNRKYCWEPKLPNPSLNFRLRRLQSIIPKNIFLPFLPKSLGDEGTHAPKIQITSFIQSDCQRSLNFYFLS